MRLMNELMMRLMIEFMMRLMLQSMMQLVMRFLAVSVVDLVMSFVTVTVFAAEFEREFGMHTCQTAEGMASVSQSVDSVFCIC